MIFLQLGGFYIWTYAFHLVKSSSEKFKALKAAEEDTERNPNKDLEANPKTHLLKEDIQV